MAISEKLCWEVLERIKGHQAVFNKGQSDARTIENAIPLYSLEKELVLRYNKAQIEDSLYFLEKRGYLNKHGFVNFTLVAYELTPQAIDVLEKGEFTEEEQRAFEEALFDIKQPGWFGMKFNLGELFRRSKKMLKIRNETK